MERAGMCETSGCPRRSEELAELQSGRKASGAGAPRARAGVSEVQDWTGGHLGLWLFCV